MKTDKKECLRVLSLPFDRRPREVLAESLARIAQTGRPYAVFTPGATVAAAAERDEELRNLLLRADLLLPDGAGVSLAARLSGAGRLPRVAGIELAESLLPLAAERGLRVFFYGGREGVAERAAALWRERYPTLSVAVADGYSGDPTEGIRAFSPHILFVCLGFPRQEEWILSRKASVRGVMLGLGGSLDVWSGCVRRAPLALRRVHMEWLWRTLCEPRRARRLLPLPRYFFACLATGVKNVLHKR